MILIGKKFTDNWAIEIAMFEKENRNNQTKFMNFEIVQNLRAKDFTIRFGLFNFLIFELTSFSPKQDEKIRNMIDRELRETTNYIM